MTLTILIYDNNKKSNDLSIYLFKKLKDVS